MRAFVVVLAVLATVLATPGTALAVTQPNPPNWGIDRIDQPVPPLDNAFTYSADGTGTRVYVLASGVNTTHFDFAPPGRAVLGFNSTGELIPGDCNGYGTHAAGVAAGVQHGVAKRAQIVSVKVYPCTVAATLADIVEGFDWVRANAVRPAVAVFAVPVTLPASVALSNSMNALIASGVGIVLHAGNGNASACLGSTVVPSVPSAFVTAATTRTDARASWSNFGPCVDMFAPGADIRGPWIGSSTVVNVLNGTSPAAAHAAGVMAQYLQTDPGATPATVTAALIAASTVGVVLNPGPGSPNRLLRTVW